MSDETSVQENLRELDREARRLARLRLVDDQTARADEEAALDEFDPDPREAA